MDGPSLDGIKGYNMPKDFRTALRRTHQLSTLRPGLYKYMSHVSACTDRLRRMPQQIPVGIGYEDQGGAIYSVQLHYGTLRAAAVTESQDRLPIHNA
jgi:hypothetical protein